MTSSDTPPTIVRSYLAHLTYWHNKSDDDCIALATNSAGVDVNEAFANLFERDFCTALNNEMLEILKNKK